MSSEPGTPRLPEPFGLGMHMTTQGRTITSGDYAAIVNASWEFSPMHSDAEYAKDTVYGKPILGGPCLIAMAAGLTVTPLYYAWNAAGYEVHAAVGIDAVRYVTPVVVGDTIRVEVGVAEMTPTPHGNAVLVTLNDVMKNQRDETVLTMHRMYLLKGITDAGAG